LVNPAHNAADFAKLKDHLRSISKPNFKVSTLDDGAIRFKFGNLNKQHGIDGTLDSNGILKFEVQAHGDPSSAIRNRLGSGSDMFDEMVSVLGRDNIKGIQGVWSRNSGLTTNLDQFYDNRQMLRMSKAEAAANTWTGQQAAKLGFEPSKVQIVDDGLRVLFTKAQ
jgi:hypothetical protein